MASLEITQEAKIALLKYSLPSKPGFGQYLAPIMIESNYEDGEWSEPLVIPFGPLILNPTAKVFHYGQEIFEGMKAYRVDGAGPFLFRPEKNYLRYVQSGNRLAIPPISKEYFMSAVETMTALCSDLIPNQSGSSLYIRPFTIATEENLGIRPSNKFKFLVIASPSGTYFRDTVISVLIERKFVRAFDGGTGAAKTGGNYASSLSSTLKAQNMELINTLWLDGKDRKFIEELSGMNFFAVFNQSLVTPPITSTILAGITRDSLIQLARHLKIKVEERPITIDELLSKIDDHTCTEAFSCGTAAVITPIEYFSEEDGNRFQLKESPGPMSIKLRDALLAIQEGRGEDPFGWRVPVTPIKN
jgi:branched-chain amino acid aminotransferase